MDHNLWAESNKTLWLLDIAPCFTSLLSPSSYFHSSQLNWVNSLDSPWPKQQLEDLCVTIQNRGCKVGGRCFLTHSTITIPKTRDTLCRNRKTAQEQQVWVATKDYGFLVFLPILWVMDKTKQVACGITVLHANGSIQTILWIYEALKQRKIFVVHLWNTSWEKSFSSTRVGNRVCVFAYF